jgi:hypothetical protein
MKRLLTFLSAILISGLQQGCLNIQVLGHIEVQEDAAGNFTRTVIVGSDGEIHDCSEVVIESFDCTFSAGEAIASDVRTHGLAGLVIALLDPVIIQVPADTTLFSGTYDNGAGTSGNLSISLPTPVLPVDLNTNLVAEPGMQLVVVDFPGFANIPLGQYHYTLRFNVPLGAPNVPLKAMFAGRVDVGGKTYYLPLLPCVTDFAGVPGVTIPEAAAPQPLLSASIVSSFQGTGCSNKTYAFGPAGPGSDNTPALVPALDPENLAWLVLLMACVGVVAGRSRRWQRR